MPTPQPLDPRITIAVDYVHIREAERLADGRRSRLRTLSPVLLAIVEQTRFHNGTFTTAGIVLFDAVTNEPTEFQHSQALRAYINRWIAGGQLEPETFTLEPIG